MLRSFASYGNPSSNSIEFRVKRSPQMPETDTKKILPLLSSSPRKNLPHSVSSKRTENNFALSFARSYIKSKKSKSFVAARELQMNGYGIPDLMYERANDSAKLFSVLL